MAIRGNSQLSKKDAIYLAGFIDGEGCIRINKPTGKNTTSYIIAVGITNTNYEIMEWINSLFSASLYIKNKGTDKWKTAYGWAIYADKAFSFIQQIRPYLRIKIKQADLALEFHKHKKKCCRYVPLNNSEREYRIQCFQKMKALNQKGMRPAETKRSNIPAKG